MLKSDFEEEAVQLKLFALAFTLLVTCHVKYYYSKVANFKAQSINECMDIYTQVLAVNVVLHDMRGNFNFEEEVYCVKSNVPTTPFHRIPCKFFVIAFTLLVKDYLKFYFSKVAHLIV